MAPRAANAGAVAPEVWTPMRDEAYPEANVVRLPDHPGRLLTKKQLAGRLGRSTRWVELRMRDGMPVVRTPHGEARFDLVDVDAWLEGPRIMPTPRAPERDVLSFISPGSAADAFGIPFGKPAVYFVQSGNCGPIKIGYVTRADMFERRIQSMQIGNPETLRALVLITVAGVAAEQALQKRFAEHRIRGEWFRPAPEILGYIAASRAVA